jgi:hypothetical protein
MRIARGLAIAFGIFAAAFALHIVGGATDQGWLFAIAVALIFVSAVGFPVIAVAAGGFDDVQSQPARLTAALGAVAGFVFTTAALWAANGRAFAWWEYPAAMALVFGGSGIILVIWRARAASRSRPQARRGTQQVARTRR